MTNCRWTDRTWKFDAFSAALMAPSDSTRYASVRAREMMEARVDTVFASIREDAQFVALTNAADGKLPIPENKKMTPVPRAPSRSSGTPSSSYQS